MKYKIKKGQYGNKEFPISFDKIRYLCHGVVGDFERPFYHNVLCICWYNENSGFEQYEILGKFKKGKTYYKYYFFGKPTLAIIKNFKTDYKKEDIDRLLEHFKSEK